MKYLPLVLRNLGRRKVRTAFTLLTIFVSFLLFGLLQAVRSGFSQGAEAAGLDRLITIHKISLIMPLPIRYGATIAALPGVEAVTHQSWFGGYYQDARNSQFAQFAVDSETYLDIHTDYVLTEQEKADWMANRTGAIVGSTTAERFGWKVGDRVPIQSTIWQNRDGSSSWEFEIEGIFEAAKKGVDTSQFFFHYDYLKEASFGMGPDGEWDFVGMYMLRIADPDQAGAIAKEIDGRFANSEYETKTTTEKAFAQSFANQMGNVGAIVTGIVAVVFFTLLLVAGNTMAQAVRERTGELGVLKTLGFTDGKVLALVLAESLVIALAGGLPGLLLSRTIVGGLDLGMAFIPDLYIRPEAMAAGAALVVALGLVTGALPAWQAMRLSIVDALRKD